MRRHLALFTALAVASAYTEGELRLSLTYNDMADDDDSTTLYNFDEPLSRVQVFHAGEWLDVCDSDGRESVSDWNMNAANVACAQMGLGHADSIPWDSFTWWAAESAGCWLTDIQCTGNEATLQQCTGGTSYNRVVKPYSQGTEPKMVFVDCHCTEPGDWTSGCGS